MKGRTLPGHRRRRAAPSSIEEGTLPFASWVEVQTKGYLGATMAAPGRSQRKGTRIATLLALAAVLATANATVTSHEDQGRAALKVLQHRAVLEQDNGEAGEASLFQRFLRWKEPQGCWTAALENAQFEHSCDKIDSEQTRRLAFSFLVCHLEEAGKPAPACRLEQQVKTCIQRLDTDSFGAWTQFRLSVLSICSMVRRDSAETRFFNLLLNSTKVLNEQMADLRSAQEEVADRIHALDTDVVAAHEQVEELSAELDDDGARARARAFFEDQKGIWQRVERVTSVWRRSPSLSTGERSRYLFRGPRRDQIEHTVGSLLSSCVRGHQICSRKVLQRESLAGFHHNLGTDLQHRILCWATRGPRTA